MTTEHDRDYVWDGSGPPDEDVRALEEGLRPLRYAGACPAAAPRRRLPAGMAIAAGVLLCVGLASLLSRGATGVIDEPWPFEILAGAVFVDGEATGASGALGGTEWLTTGPDASVRLEVADIGQMTVHGSSQLRVRESRTDSIHRVELARGRIEAFITAPPRLFFVNTPAAVAVDLGCAYVLDVDEKGNGALDVTFGLVSLESLDAGGLEARVPRGARCMISAADGHGTPCFEDATPAMHDAIGRFDGGDQSADVVGLVLAEAREADLLTLWHVLQRVGAAERARVVAGMESLRALPDDVRRQDLVALDGGAIERLWKSFDSAW